MKETFDALERAFGIDKKVIRFCHGVEKNVKDLFEQADENAVINQAKTLAAMQRAKLSETHFFPATGYGYNDAGRDALERIYADVFNVESTLVRPQIISGTHALKTTLFGNLRHGDELISPVGKPYDTLEGVIGAREARGSLKEHGVVYKQVEFKADGSVDFDGIKAAVTPKTKMASIQRSKGYEWRRALSIPEIKEIIAFIKGVKSDVICMVDNCYGEFTDTLEPSDVGADLTVGSLIKNPGGGLATVGGYIAGKSLYVENAAFHLSSPGLGREVGPSLGMTRAFAQGLFLAPSVTASALKCAIFASAVFDALGCEVNPKPFEKRSDIVQAIKMRDAKSVIAFCRGVQKSAPVDSFVTPEPWPMPGYNCDVIMAAGSFIQGSSIELSADAPLKEPYIAYMQGGLTWSHAKVGVIIALNHMVKEGLFKV
ncbi:MAG: methionine gamma-lyase family protein [Clostridiales bacterium]|jgi:cystathionine beta-lyase family protein involved in aluminum resistance|nr:methionine gamma-lyase family protein [Clostridiales bacterium]